MGRSTMSGGIRGYHPCIRRFQEDAMRPWSSAVYRRLREAGTVLRVVYTPTRGDRSLQGILEMPRPKSKELKCAQAL